MPRTNFKYKDIIPDDSKGKVFLSLSRKSFESFNSSILGLGNIAENGKYVQALAACYDLEGFTAFCNQVDSHLAIPEFLKSFIDWLFSDLAEYIKHDEQNRRVTLWGSLPFFTKFLGDGILLLWNTDANGEHAIISNIIGSLHNVSMNYQTEFLPKIRKQVSHPPSKLRCGVARGQIISIGDGNDYVGSCINIASRLQKLSQLTFAISRRGVDLSQVPPHIKYWKQFILKKVELRGIGDDELVYVSRKEFRKLPENERRLFKNP